MKHRITITLLLWALLGYAMAHAAAPAVRLLFPHVANGAIQTRLIKLVDQDCGFVNAVATSDGRVFVDYQTRPDGHVHLTEQIGDALRERAVLTDTVALAPQSTLPGPKQGSVSQVIVGGELRTYFTGRAEGDPSGPFLVWVLVEPIPPIVRL